MSDLKFRDDVADLVARYLSGNASQTDVSALEQWVLHTREHRDQFLAMKKPGCYPVFLLSLQIFKLSRSGSQ
ncbi:MAG: hypothetical protein IPL46_17810 [Saprospiraceae bacterium]|nr:hypothetical protein [Saprospiraceae bacterium]